MTGLPGTAVPGGQASHDEDKAGRPALGLVDFDYDLPPDLIATRPAVPRDAARLLVVGQDLRDRSVADLPQELRDGDLLVFNDTRVLPVRLTGRIGEGRVEATLVDAPDGALWRALVKPGKRFRDGAHVTFGALTAQVADRHADGSVTLRFDRAGEDLRRVLEVEGDMPLPPYIAKLRAPDAQDRADYQTVFAAHEGSVAAPTAGLHFTPALLERLRARGVALAPVTLHVGPGTFLPVKVERLADHQMHAEWGALPAATAAAIAATRARGGRVVPIGTTALRVLESAALAAPDGAPPGPWSGETRLFVTPGFRFRVADGLVTNFHLPKSTLLMLVSALGGMARMRAAYAHAVAQRYRFFSYGDASLIWPASESA
ncbi:tRNA preQ1(34) S-adenosylmethionine ribosyltransferase-isomerase QueA [Zavarzinia sp. CC-PAN008]|uniref:tRNA preQ1(34) S-adenosylmethionine ribosyltransferase-isomerase QueA n=1 Tax=Zavarzinia sp. CC-PAN008 TaxID=3243332 RepID=UPI003F7452B9